MSSKVYVGNMNYATTAETLTSLFSEFGEVVSATVIKDRFTEQSKGFGFVEMSDEAAAEAAIAALNGKELEGRRLRVNVAEERSRNDRPRRDFNREGGYNRGPREGGYNRGGNREGGFNRGGNRDYSRPRGDYRHKEEDDRY